MFEKKIFLNKLKKIDIDKIKLSSLERVALKAKIEGDKKVREILGEKKYYNALQRAYWKIKKFFKNEGGEK